MQAKIEIMHIKMISEEEWNGVFGDPDMTIAEEMLLFQQHHSEARTMKGALQLIIHEDVLSSRKSGMYSSVLTFKDQSRLYREEDVLYKMHDHIKYTKD